MYDVPVEQWSTKSLAARWTAQLRGAIDAELRPRGDDLVSGRVTNRTGVKLEDAALLHGRWALQLPPLAPDATVDVDQSLPQITIRTLLTSVAAGDDRNVRPTEDASVVFDAEGSDVARIAKAMMFHEAIGGAAYTQTPQRYQSFIDLSRLLHGDQAILLARAPESAGSRWTFGDGAGTTHGDRRWVYYRFVIPLAAEGGAQAPSGPLFGPSLNTPR
jgi:hypothetical protein